MAQQYDLHGPYATALRLGTDLAEDILRRFTRSKGKSLRSRAGRAGFPNKKLATN